MRGPPQTLHKILFLSQQEQHYNVILKMKPATYLKIINGNSYIFQRGGNFKMSIPVVSYRNCNKMCVTFYYNHFLEKGRIAINK